MEPSTTASAVLTTAATAKVAPPAAVTVMAWERATWLRPWLSSFRSPLARSEGLQAGSTDPLALAATTRVLSVLMVFFTTAAPTAMPPVAATAAEMATIWPSRLAPLVSLALATPVLLTSGLRLPLASSRVPAVGSAPLTLMFATVNPTPWAPSSRTRASGFC